MVGGEVVVATALVGGGTAVLALAVGAIDAVTVRGVVVVVVVSAGPECSCVDVGIGTEVVGAESTADVDETVARQPAPITAVVVIATRRATPRHRSRPTLMPSGALTSAARLGRARPERGVGR